MSEEGDISSCCLSQLYFCVSLLLDMLRISAWQCLLFVVHMFDYSSYIPVFSILQCNLFYLAHLNGSDSTSRSYSEHQSPTKLNNYNSRNVPLFTPTSIFCQDSVKILPFPTSQESRGGAVVSTPDLVTYVPYVRSLT